MTEISAALVRIENPIRDYAWGSLTSLAGALGTEPSGRPQAEMWLGAHPGDPSRLADGGLRLDQFLAARPDLLGASAERFGGQLPFLMKLLAAAKPLSLQVHPTMAQARAGFARDEAAGVALNDPLRTYKDPFHKPEIIVAISPFQALCGFRSPRQAREELVDLFGEAMSASAVGVELEAALSLADEPAALRAAFALIMSGRPEVRSLAALAVQAASTSATPLAGTIRWLGEHYLDDPGVLGAALLNRVDLMPGEALYLSSGNIHAYLSGFGIEAMAPSDNVLRGGLTPKHVDVAGLLEIVRFEAISPFRVEPAVSQWHGGELRSYRPPVAEFSVHIIQIESGARTLPELAGPSVLVVMSGRVELRADRDALVLERGQSAFQAAGRPLSVRSLESPATIYLTTTG